LLEPDVLALTWVEEPNLGPGVRGPRPDSVRGRLLGILDQPHDTRSWRWKVRPSGRAAALAAASGPRSRPLAGVRRLVEFHPGGAAERGERSASPPSPPGASRNEHAIAEFLAW